MHSALCNADSTSDLRYFDDGTQEERAQPYCYCRRHIQGGRCAEFWLGSFSGRPGNMPRRGRRVCRRDRLKPSQNQQSLEALLNLSFESLFDFQISQQAIDCRGFANFDQRIRVPELFAGLVMCSPGCFFTCNGINVEFCAEFCQMRREFLRCEFRATISGKLRNSKG